MVLSAKQSQGAHAPISPQPPLYPRSYPQVLIVGRKMSMKRLLLAELAEDLALELVGEADVSALGSFLLLVLSGSVGVAGAAATDVEVLILAGADGGLGGDDLVLALGGRDASIGNVAGAWSRGRVLVFFI